jgi:hypothetical protein
LPAIDRDTLLAVWDLLRTEEARNAFRQRLLSFSGAITMDKNGDGAVNSRAEYRNGALISYSLDDNQDGIDEMLIVFESGRPVSAELEYKDGYSRLGTDRDGKVFIVWEMYPALREAVRAGERYFFRPMEFNYPAVRFQTLAGPDGVPFSLPENGAVTFTDNLMLANAYRIERPGGDFPGGIERIECEGGVVSSSKQYLNGRLVAETSYEKGLPVFQRIDLDLDGRMETVKRFKRAESPFSPLLGADPALPPEIEVIESDWDGDGFVEYREE